jgi:hypothetical protein
LKYPQIIKKNSINGKNNLKSSCFKKIVIGQINNGSTTKFPLLFSNGSVTQYPLLISNGISVADLYNQQPNFSNG